MSTELVTLSPTDSLARVQELFMKNRIHHLPVVDDHMKLLGLITTYDMFKLKVAPANFAEVPVGEIMTKRIAALEPDDKVGAAAEVLLEHLFHAVPIVKDDRLVGIITSFDILRYEFRKEYPQHEFARD